MIHEQELLDAIAECKGEKNPNANTCRNLASYYTILEHIRKENNDNSVPQYSTQAYIPPETEKLNYYGDSEFACLINNIDVKYVIQVIDELMTTLEIINPKLYAGVMRKLTEY